MKKSVILFLSFLFVAGFSFAQSTASALPDEKDNVDLSMRVINVQKEKAHLAENDRTGSVWIEYIPMTDEARIYYKCMYVAYDQGNAMNSVLGCLEDFTKENKYYRYTYLEKDRERYFRDDRGIAWAQYQSHVKFTR